MPELNLPPWAKELARALLMAALAYFAAKYGITIPPSTTTVLYVGQATNIGDAAAK